MMYLAWRNGIIRVHHGCKVLFMPPSGRNVREREFPIVQTSIKMGAGVSFGTEERFSWIMAKSVGLSSCLEVFFPGNRGDVNSVPCSSGGVLLCIT